MPDWMRQTSIRIAVQLRNQHLPALCEQGEGGKFVDLMQSESKNPTLSLATFLFFAFSRRSSNINQRDKMCT